MDGDSRIGSECKSQSGHNVAKERQSHIFGLQLVIGDTIVWWRACILWQRKLVNSIGQLLVASTTSMSELYHIFSFIHLIPPTSLASLGCTSLQPPPVESKRLDLLY